LWVSVGLASNTAPSNATWMVDIGQGAAGSEIGVGGTSATTGLVDLPFRLAWDATSTAGAFGPYFGPLPVSIPAGTRLAARAKCSITDATDRQITVALYGLD